MSLIDVVAGAVARMDAAQLVELLGRVAPGLEIRLADHDRASQAIVPRRLTPAMIAAAGRFSWTEQTRDANVQALWTTLVSMGEKS